MSKMNQIYSLMEAGEYQQALDLCSPIIGNDLENTKAASICTLYCLILTLPIFNEEAKEKILQLVSGYSEVLIQTLQDRYDFDYALKHAINKREFIYKSNILEYISLQAGNTMDYNDSDNPWRLFIGAGTKFAMFSMNVTMYDRGCNQDVFDALLKNEGLTKEEAENKYYREPPKYTEELNQQLFLSAETLFDDAAQLFEDNQSCLPDVCMHNLQFLLNNSMYSELMCDYLLRSETIDKQLTMKCLHHLLFVKRYTLGAVVYPNGNAMPVLTRGESRNDKIQEAREVIDKLEKLDPSFVAPDLPQKDDLQALNTSNSGGGGCYVATCVYGSYDCPQVWTLRRYRDDILAKSRHGRAFIKTYYAISPTLVKWFGHTQWFKRMWQGKLDNMVNNLQQQGIANTPYEDKQW